MANALQQLGWALEEPRAPELQELVDNLRDAYEWARRVPGGSNGHADDILDAINTLKPIDSDYLRAAEVMEAK